MMKWNFLAPTPLQYFAQLVQSDAHLPLLEAAACIAQDEYPDLDVQQVLNEVDLLLARLRRRLAPDAPHLQRLRMLCRFFYQDLGFGSERRDEEDPDQYHLNVVLQRRRGAPIALGLIAMELAQGIGLATRGLRFPGHFLLKVGLPQGHVLIDPASGQSLSREDLLARLARHRTDHPADHPGVSPPSMGQDGENTSLRLHLRTASEREILAVVLHRLKKIHHDQLDGARVAGISERLAVLLPQA